jgi:putative PIN family toxin of toxin-antitoxin system
LIGSSPTRVPLRLVLDTNIVIAGLLWNGPPRHLLDLAIDEAVALYSSPVLLDELAHSLRYRKFAPRIERFATTVETLVARYAALVAVVAPSTVPRVVRDADDDHVIAAALAARADCIVTGDNGLLCLGSHEGIAIIAAAEAVKRIGSNRIDGA